MYTEISKSDFEKVMQNKISIRDLYDAVVVPSTLDSDLEKSKEEKYSLLHAIGVHKLKAGDMPMLSVKVCV